MDIVGRRYERFRCNASLTLAVGHSVRNNSLLNLGATGLLSTVAKAKAEVGVVAETRGVRLAVDGGAAQVSLLGEHVADAGSLDDVFSKMRMASTQEQRGLLTPHSGTEFISWP